MNSPIKYYGGKSYMTDFILNNFPKQYDLYVEGFGGGASVLLAKEPTTCEVYNDLGRNVYSLFKVLSDKSLFDLFKVKCDLIPYSEDFRAEYIEKLNSDEDLVDRAFHYFYMNRTSFNGVGGLSKNVCCRRTMCKSVSDYLSAIDCLPQIHERLSRVMITNRDIIQLLDDFDDCGTFVYLDPPYVQSTRVSNTKYECEMTDEQHVKLLERCLSFKGKIMISGYKHQIYDMLLSNGWFESAFESNNSKSDNLEFIWRNYDESDKGLFS